VRDRNKKKPSLSIRYLLLADRKFQKLSLKRISARFKNAKQPSRSRNTATDKAFNRLQATSSAAMGILLVVVCVVTAVALITARQPVPESELVSQDSLPTPIEERDAPPLRTRVETKKTTAMAKSTAPVAAKTSPIDAKTSPIEKTPAKTPAAESPNLPSVTNVEAVAPVTITGCLEIAKGTFRLKDTSGTDAPKSRSWKSGFLKRRSSQIEVVDVGNTLKLPTYVGQRVVATGTVTNGEMRARSVKRVAASCS
jgi:hypothetical protein